MEPLRDLDYKLVDVLNALLDTGVVINADVVITVSGIPLIGINLRAALAGMATMLDYGLMEAWDESIRKYYAKEIEERKLPLSKDEKIIFSTFGSHYYNQGISKTWRHGTLYLTNKRLMLFRKDPREILFETSIEKIRGLMIQKEDHFGKERDELHVWLENGNAILYSNNIEELESMIEKDMLANGIVPQHDFPTELMRSSFSNERIIQKEKLWYLSSASDVIGETWLPGCIYVTDERVYWRYQLDGKILFDAPVKNVTATEVDETRTYVTFRIPTKHKILKILHKDSDSETVLFSGEELKIKRIKSAIENVNNNLLNHV